MLEIRKSAEFAAWLDEPRDVRGRARVHARIERLAAGNPGDVKPVGPRRVGTAHRLRPWLPRLFAEATVISLAEETQAADIKTALRLARNL